MAQALADLSVADPELHESVRSGDVSLKAAVNRVRRQKEDEAKAGREAALQIESARDERFAVDHGDCLGWFADRPGRGRGRPWLAPGAIGRHARRIGPPVAPEPRQ